MFNDFQGHDQIEALCAPGQIFGCGEAIINLKPLLEGMGLRDGNGLGRGVDPRDPGPFPRQRLGHQAAAAPDIKDPKAFKRLAYLFLNIAQTQRPHLVQSAESPSLFPPFPGLGGKTDDFIRKNAWD